MKPKICIRALENSFLLAFYGDLFLLLIVRLLISFTWQSAGRVLAVNYVSHFVWFSLALHSYFPKAVALTHWLEKWFQISDCFSTHHMWLVWQQLVYRYSWIYVLKWLSHHSGKFLDYLCFSHFVSKLVKQWNSPVHFLCVLLVCVLLVGGRFSSPHQLLLNFYYFFYIF